MFSKTPIVIPLRDENAPNIYGGKLGKGNETENFPTNKKRNATFDKNVYVTPKGPQNRAPLGIKTTNAKLNAFQTPAWPIKQQELEIPQIKTTSVRRPGKVVHTDSTKLKIHGGENPHSDVDIEYCPPPPKSLPYESDTFPNNCLDYSYIRPQSIVRDLYKKNLRSQTNGIGLSILEKKQEEAYQSHVKLMNEAMLKSMEENWTVADISESLCHQHRTDTRTQQVKCEKLERKKSRVKQQGPTALILKTATTRALPVVDKSAKIQPKISKPASKQSLTRFSTSKPSQKQLSSKNTDIKCYSTLNTASRSSIGYSKGRDIPRILQEPKQKDQVETKSIDSSICPDTLASIQERRRPGFLKIFHEDEELEPALRGILPDCIINGEEDEEFFITLE